MVTRYHLQLWYYIGQVTLRAGLAAQKGKKAAKIPLVSAPRWVKGSNGGGEGQGRAAGNNFPFLKGCMPVIALGSLGGLTKPSSKASAMQLPMG